VQAATRTEARTRNRFIHNLQKDREHRGAGGDRPVPAAAARHLAPVILHPQSAPRHPPLLVPILELELDAPGQSRTRTRTRSRWRSKEFGRVIGLSYHIPPGPAVTRVRVRAGQGRSALYCSRTASRSCSRASQMRAAVSGFLISRGMARQIRWTTEPFVFCFARRSSSQA